MFDRLYQMDDARLKKGSDLGFYIAKELVAAYQEMVVANHILGIKKFYCYYFMSFVT